jgi:type I restriction enzyme S subunit
MAEKNVERTYDPTSSAVFLKTNERFGGLSNMAPGYPLIVNGVAIRTSEALYQACRFPHLPEIQRRILAERSPMTAKMRGKPFHKESRLDWNAVRVNIMRWCLRVKLAQNWEKFSSLLLETGDLPIVEKKVRRTDFWGAKEMPRGELVGRNVLGRLLMELREQVKTGAHTAVTVVQPLDIPHFLLLGKLIEPISGETGRPKAWHDRFPHPRGELPLYQYRA